jgi:hypothetical protein
MSVEKVFRLYLDPSAGVHDTVRLDRRMDEFLQEHFREYNRYFGFRDEEMSSDGEVVFTHLREDKQEDDLTVMAIRRK